VAAWMAPDSMRLHVHSFDPRPGGRFRISLTYPPPEAAQRGKTSGDTDTYHGRNVPTGIRPEDNEAGSRSSLQKLAALVE
jgi:hypothetical protein